MLADRFEAGQLEHLGLAHSVGEDNFVAVQVKAPVMRPVAGQGTEGLRSRIGEAFRKRPAGSGVIGKLNGAFDGRVFLQSVPLRIPFEESPGPARRQAHQVRVKTDHGGPLRIDLDRNAFVSDGVAANSPGYKRSMIHLLHRRGRQAVGGNEKEDSGAG